jgi:hypothetical protein
MLMYLQKLQERQFLLFPQGRRRPRVKYSGHRRVSVCRIDVLAPLDMDNPTHGISSEVVTVSPLCHSDVLERGLALPCAREYMRCGLREPEPWVCRSSACCRFADRVPIIQYTHGSPVARISHERNSYSLAGPRSAPAVAAHQLPVSVLYFGGQNERALGQPELAEGTSWASSQRKRR